MEVTFPAAEGEQSGDVMMCVVREESAMCGTRIHGIVHIR